MKVEYEGFFDVERGPEHVFRFLTDPSRFSKAFPGFKGVEVRGEGEFKALVSLRLGPLSGEGSVAGRIVESREPSHAKVQGVGRGAGSHVEYVLTFNISEESPGVSRVSWRFEGDVGGIAASMGGRVLDSLVKRLVNDIVAKMRKEILGG